MLAGGSEAEMVFSAAGAGDLAKLKEQLDGLDEASQRALIEDVQFINPRTKLAGTALDHAVFNDHADCINYLIGSCHADVNCRKAKGHYLGKEDPPLSIACHYARLSAAQALLQHSPKLDMVVGKNKFSLLAAASANLSGSADALKVVKALIAEYKKRGVSPDASKALWAICSRSPNVDLSPICSLLLEEGADITIVNEKGLSLLHVAQAESIVDMLLSHGGIDINVTDFDGETPLHTCCREGLKQVAEALLKNGARVDVTNSSGQTPYDVASSMCKRVLSEHGDLNTSGLSAEGSCEC